MSSKIPRFADAKRIVIKVGSSLVADSTTSTAHSAWLASLAADIAALHAAGKDSIVVSSGAVALGRARMGLGTGVLTLQEKQAAASLGQPLLMQAWHTAFAPHGIEVAQILLTLEDSERRRRYLNARDTMQTLLAQRVIPIVNENDTVATAEIKVGDNDRLAARVAVMSSAEVLILFSDIDGLYTADPRKDKTAQRIPIVDSITPDILAMAGDAATATSNGGMRTKLDAASMAMSAGCHMVIAPGHIAHPLAALQTAGAATWFIANTKPQIARKHWIATAMQTAGTLVIDEGAEHALTQGKSLLPAGVRAIEGAFDRGDTVAVKNTSGALLARGISAYSADEARRIMGKKTGAITGILGYEGQDTIIHRDDLALL